MRERLQQFINSSGPERLPSGELLIAHAPEISYQKAFGQWQRRIERLEEIRDDYQVVVLPPHPGTVSEKIMFSKNSLFSSRYPIATMTRQMFPDGEDRLLISDESSTAKHIYIVASPETKCDMADVQRVAHHYIHELGASYVTAVLSFVTATRQDKNAKSDGSYMPSPINIAADLEGLTRVNSIMVIEPHSFTTESAASEAGKPLLPATPWKFLMDQVIGCPIDLGKNGPVVLTPKNTVIVRPDQGRNIAAGRSSACYKLPSASFTKVRLGPNQVVLNMDEKDCRKISGKWCLFYDDEFATAGTLAKIARELEIRGAKGLIVIGVHGKFTDKWEENIQNPFIRKIFITDSRSPVGDIRPYIANGKIKVLSIENFIADIIETDIRGINFWKDVNYRHLVLQSQGKREMC